MIPKMYVSHTYGRRHGLSDEECESNAYKALEYGRILILKGWNPYIPNLFHFVHKGWRGSPEEDKYFELVSEWIIHCDALFVAEMPKWTNSGVQKEIEIADKLGILVYWRIEDVPSLIKKSRVSFADLPSAGIWADRTDIEELQ